MIVENEEVREGINLIEIKDVIDIKLLQKFQDNFSASMNIASVIVDNKGIPVTKPSFFTAYCSEIVHWAKMGDSRCAECHRRGGLKSAKIGKPYVYTCHAGLIDFAAPILIKGHQIGTILGGQVLIEKPQKSTFIHIADALEVNKNDLLQEVKKVRILNKKRVESAAEVLFLVANALSKIGYEELKLRNMSKKLSIEVEKKNKLIEDVKKYDDFKSRLYSIVSHELKTPVNIIFSIVQLIERLQKNESIKESIESFSKYSNIMKNNCYRLVRMVNNLIDMNKIESGYNKLDLKNYDIIKFVEDITTSIIKYAELKNIDVIFDTDVEEKAIAFDAEKMERVILNLLANAIKFNKENGKIFVSIYDKEEYVLISIKDTGIGISEDMKNQIFNTFSREDLSLSRETEGSGIGLALVKAFVEMHHGEISVKSELGCGSEFIIKIPCKIEQNEINYDKHIIYNTEKTKVEFSDIYF